MKIIVAPDKFKGSLSSLDACRCIESGIMQIHGDAEVYLFPMADGGDGFASVLKYYLNTQTVDCKTVDPIMRNMSATYEWDAINKTAIIELASASGLMLLKKEEANALKTSTYGTGLLIKQAIDAGAEKIILGIGGSATNDAGIGILMALGFQFRDAENNILSPTGENLIHIQNVISPQISRSIQFIIACDVQNVLFGREGAALIYAAQKGADENAVLVLDQGLEHFAGIIKSQTGKDIASFAGAGAAGGVAAGLSAYFTLKIISGARLLVTVSKIENQLANADLIITGEGKLDTQTVKGKVVQCIAECGSKYNVPVVAICGEAAVTDQQIKLMRLSSVISLINNHTSEHEAIEQAGKLLTDAAAELINTFEG